ncbi:MAG: hypothetical protein WD271_11975 [Acidimicrobiia bacterium]
MATKTNLKIGDRVRVPWGVDAVDGTIVQLHGPPGRRFALVRIPVRGSAGETLEETEVSLPERELTIVGP